MAVIQKHIIKCGKRTIVHKYFRSKEDEQLVATWRLNLDDIRRVFDVRLLTFYLAVVKFLILDRTYNKHGCQYS